MSHEATLKIICKDLVEFEKTLHEKGIQKAIVTWREEWAPAGEIPGENHGEVTFGSLREIEVLGYHRASGTIIGVVLRGPEAQRPAIREHLLAAGLSVSERCRNLT
jgi:hypothetical protein